jgi:hypothetical protein
MKSKSFKLIISILLVSIISCNEPETVVTNIVHSDGSVTRKLEMKSTEGDAKKRFNISDIQVPIDSTWAITDSCEVNEKGDTTFIRRAVKLFRNTEEINKDYLDGKGANKEYSRRVDFIKKFRWFNTICRFSEKIDKIMSNGYPVSNFLDQEELRYFYSPEAVNSEKLKSSDSLKYRRLEDTIKFKTDIWLLHSMVSEWIQKFSGLAAGKGMGDQLKESLKSREKELVNLISRDENKNKFDSLWSNGIILKEYLGEADYLRFKTEADTAADKVLLQILNSFKNYSVRVSMPGKLIGTNGFMDSSEVLLWPVKSDYFLTDQYEMWAESKIPNKWAWIISGLFLVFVITGVIIRVIKKAE